MYVKIRSLRDITSSVLDIIMSSGTVEQLSIIFAF